VRLETLEVYRVEVGIVKEPAPVRAASTVLLCDVSASMDETAGRRRKIDILRDALADLAVLKAQLVAFSTHAMPVARPQDLPEPDGGTALHHGLDAAARYRPSRTVVISDGRPNSQRAALAAAERVPGRIDVVYCGPDSDIVAIDFMRRLARVGGGQVVIRDLARGHALLAGDVRAMLGLPAPGSKP
jgi:Mg-chelatase subunit ChlD